MSGYTSAIMAVAAVTSAATAVHGMTQGGPPDPGTPAIAAPEAVLDSGANVQVGAENSADAKVSSKRATGTTSRQVSSLGNLGSRSGLGW